MLLFFGRRSKQHESGQIDHILEGLFLSQQSDKLKEAFVSRICTKNSCYSHADEATAMGVMKVSSKWILHGTSDMQVSSGFKLFNFWGSNNPTTFQVFFTPGFVAEILRQVDGVAANVPLLIRDGFRVMDKVNARLGQEHSKMVQRHIGNFVGSTRERVVVCNSVQLLEEFPECVPLDVRNGGSLCLAVLDHLSVGVTSQRDEEVDGNTAYSHMGVALFRILFQVLLGFEDSPEFFQKCLEKMCIILQRLEVEGTPEAKQFRNQMSKLICDLIQHRVGFTEMCAPVLKLLQDTPESAAATNILNQDKLAFQSTGSVAMEADVPSLSITCSISHETPGPRKAGLVNLGNTCYMNSVLQALFMCDQFRRDVLGKTPDRKETLLMKLQLVFAHLSQSNRPAISPSKFLHASRPAWFVPGHQQDCSEFLKYLLSELHEEERSATSLSELGIKASLESVLSPGTVRMKVRSLNQASVTLPAMIREPDIKMHGLKLSDNDSSAKSSVESLIEKTFRGKVQTTLRCVACSHESLTVESFDDISLAFPNSSVSSFDSHKSLAGGGGTYGADTQAESEQVMEAETASPPEEFFSLDDLISYYLKPEKLTGDNKYHCGRCRKLQDGEKRIQIIESPQYLIFTLLRFSYDTKRQTRTKIFYNVNYPRTLELPVCNSPVSQDPTLCLNKQRSINENSKPSDRITSLVDSHSIKLENISRNLAFKFENCQHDSQSHLLYSLCGVIIHSGLSSENGHYYCYARHSQTGQINVELLDQTQGSLDDLDFLPDAWYNFNDGVVSSVTFNSFRNVTKRFSKDTPYILIYRRLDPGRQSCEVEIEPMLHPHLWDAVMKDNEAFIKEREAAAKAEERRRSRSSPSFSQLNSDTWYRRPDHDDDDISQSGGHRGHWEEYGLDIGGSRYLF